MRTQLHTPSPIRRSTQHRLEIGIFLLASTVGIYGIGEGLAGLYERGHQINLLWLAVTGIAFFVLCAQMGRVHDTWPRRPSARASRTVITPAAARAESWDADRN